MYYAKNRNNYFLAFNTEKERDKAVSNSKLVYNQDPDHVLYKASESDIDSYLRDCKTPQEFAKRQHDFLSYVCSQCRKYLEHCEC